jgi:mRNA-degrading endonuclease RelE of RelBE toxin-antitoxin system
MVDRITKELQRLDPKLRKVYLALIAQILNGDLQTLDVVRLKGSQGTFRVRKGKYRVIFHKKDSGEIIIIAFEHRSESTYK